MNLKLSPNRKTGRTYLSIVRGYRDKETGKARATTIKSLGYLDELEKLYPDPIAHFREVARQMTEEHDAKRFTTLSLNLDETLPPDVDLSKNLGYAAILRVFYELDLQRFFDNASRSKRFGFNSGSIMALLVISRILSPGSKKKAFEQKGRYFERFDFSLADVYRALSHFSSISKATQRHINSRIMDLYGRDTHIVYYDVTNFYFEINDEDEGDGDLRKRGVSKEHRKDPIVQMGLAMDADGIPLHYELFPGNIPDVSTFRDVIGEVRRNYNTGRIIVVADMGLVSGDNIFYLTGGEKKEKTNNGYVFSFSVRGGAHAFQQYVLDPTDYRGMNGEPLTPDAEFMVKSRCCARQINVTQKDGSIAKKTVYEKQVAFWSKKYALRARAEREKVLLKAAAIIRNPGQYSRTTSYGAAKYIRGISFDKKTGEVIQSAEHPVLDADKIAHDALFDGYYAIVTSESSLSHMEIIDIYRGLWEIEETFSIAKGTLESRPVYLSLEDRIEAHFLSCFIALVIMRLLQKLTGRRFSCDVIVDCLNRINCINEDDNLYLFGYRDKVSDTIGEALGIDFTKKRMLLSEIKSLLARCKEPSLPVQKKSRNRLK